MRQSSENPPVRQSSENRVIRQINDNSNSPARRKRRASPFRQSVERKILSTTIEKPFGM